MKIALLENIHKIAQEKLIQKGHQVDHFAQSYEGQQLIDLLQDYEAVGIRSKTMLTDQILSACSHLQVIGCFCIGTNQVDLASARRNGIPVFNAPYSNTRSVAELVIAEMVALSRNLFDMSSKVHQGVWQKSASGAFEVRGKTVGIVGFGHIGSQVCILAEAFGMKVIYYDVLKKLPLGNSNQTETLEELLREADFVTLHVPETPDTQNMITETQIKQMKKGSYLINASRGTVVDLAALKTALNDKHLAGAAIDVYPEEPQKNDDKDFISPLQNCPNTILTPHIGGSTQEAQFKIGQEVAESLDVFIAFAQTVGSVDFPNLQPSPDIKGRRLVNVHKNVPGVLGAINSIVSQAQINIHSQQLSTHEEIGYLIMDIEQGHMEAFDKIRALPTSIKTRLI